MNTKPIKVKKNDDAKDCKQIARSFCILSVCQITIKVLDVLPI